MAFTQAIADTYQRSGFGPAMAQFILAVSHKGPMTAGVRRPAGARSGDVRPARRGRRHPHRPAALPEHHHLHPLRARLRRAARGLDPDRARRRRGVGRRDGAPRSGGRRRATRHRHRSSSRAATAASSAASTVRPASRTPSPRSCARSSPRPERQRKAAGFGAENAGSGQAPGDELGAAFQRVVTAGGHAAVQLEEVRSVDDEDPADGPAG